MSQNNTTFYNHYEKMLIAKIASYGIQKTFSVNSLLEHLFFNKGNKRSLIIQIKDNYAVFFLPIKTFDNEIIRSEEISFLIQLFSLINRLNASGYITIYKDNYSLKQEIYCLGNEFDEPRIQGGRIILNAEGAYSDCPVEIKNKNGETIYKGVVFRDSEILIKNAIGKIYISDKILELKKSYSSPRRKKKKHKLSFLNILNFIALITLLSFTYYIGNDIKRSNELDKNHIASKITELSKKIEYQDKYNNVKNIIEDKEDDRVLKYGIDISRWNGDIFNEELPDSLSFIICKATEGITLVDPMFQNNWKKIREMGLKRGAYHFYILRDNPIQQAEYFWDKVKNQDSFDFPPILDVERGSIKHNQSINKDTLQVNLLIFLDHIEKLSNTIPMIYSSYSFANNYLTYEQFSKYPLWIADYSDNKKPRISHVWKDKGHIIWQKQDDYHIGSTTIDFDIFCSKESSRYESSKKHFK